MTKKISTFQIRFACADEFSMKDNGWIHCKTMPFYIFAQAFEGHYEVETGNRKVVCETGGAFFSSPGTPLKIHHFVNPATGVMRIRFLHFMLENEHGADPFSFRIPPLSVPAKDCVTVARKLSGMIDSKRDPFSDNILLLCILEKLYRLTEPKMENKQQWDYLEKLCDWIRIRASGPLTVGEVVAKSGYSRSKLFPDFRHFTGMPPGDFILRERIAAAERMLLENPVVGIQETAAKCGWKNPYHFSRMFKKATGMPPGKYRKHPLY